MKQMLFMLFILCGTGIQLCAQDTFYVKKRTQVTRVANAPRPAWDSTNTDSIVSYTAEYQKPGTNIYARIHMTGPKLSIPPEVYGRGVRVLFTEIIAVDAQGRKYRQPDRYWINGITVPVKEK